MKIRNLTRKQLIRLIRLILKVLDKTEKPVKDYEAFRLAMGKSESGNNYRIVNSLGYLGYYQFGMARLCDLGYTKRIKKGWSNDCFKWRHHLTDDTFLNAPKLQDKIFKEHVEDLVVRINKYCSIYLGKRVNGVRVTRSGLVAGAHLGGLGGVKRFLTTGFDPKDVISGVPMTSYIKKFAGYDLNYEK
jgi:hypothetical protein